MMCRGIETHTFMCIPKYVYYMFYELCCSSAPLSGFKAAVMRTVSRTRSYSSSSDDNPLNRQSSNRSKKGDFLSALTDHLSRMSVEDLPLAAHPSPLPSRHRTVSPNYELPPDAFQGTEEVCINT